MILWPGSTRELELQEHDRAKRAQLYNLTFSQVKMCQRKGEIYHNAYKVTGMSWPTVYAFKNRLLSGVVHNSAICYDNSQLCLWFRVQSQKPALTFHMHIRCLSIFTGEENRSIGLLGWDSVYLFLHTFVFCMLTTTLRCHTCKFGFSHLVLKASRWLTRDCATP